MSSLHFRELICIKRDNGELSEDQIQSLVSDVSKGNASREQIGALMMAIYINGMTRRETAWLTASMRHSGDVLSWPQEWKTVLADKHSTGGVGDKVSLPLAPLLAACGLKVPMISGRSLGATGGTLDKLESIPGFRVELSAEEMYAALSSVGCCIVGQTAKLVPADRCMYACRDQTETVNNRALIVSSILSKKAAEGIRNLVLDVKYGPICSVKNPAEAADFATDLVVVGTDLGLHVSALVTSMESPLGHSVGNALEVAEAVHFLNDENVAPDLKEVVFALGAELLTQSGKCSDEADALNLLQSKIDSRAGIQTFQQMLVAQGVEGDVALELCRSPESVLKLANRKERLVYNGVKANISSISADVVSSVAAAVSRDKMTGALNHGPGIILVKSVGDSLENGECWAELHHDKDEVDKLVGKLQSALHTTDARVDTTRVARTVRYEQ